MEHHDGGHQPGQVDPHLPSFVQVVPPQPVQFSQPVPVVADPGYNRGQVSTYNFSNVVGKCNDSIRAGIAIRSKNNNIFIFDFNKKLLLVINVRMY